MRPEFAGTYFSFDGQGDRGDLHSFPTRRSADLFEGWKILRRACTAAGRGPAEPFPFAGPGVEADPFFMPDRSEEHTSELQSQSNIVCRLLLEKNNATPINHAAHPHSHTLSEPPA